jgi:hypothetical protein
MANVTSFFYIQHQIGPSINNARSGHFFSEVFSDGIWYQCNDETVTTLKGPTLTSSSVCFTAYVAIEEINLALSGQSSMTLTGELTARSTGSRAQSVTIIPSPPQPASRLQAATIAVATSIQRASAIR